MSYKTTIVISLTLLLLFFILAGSLEALKPQTIGLKIRLYQEPAASRGHRD